MAAWTQTQTRIIEGAAEIRPLKVLLTILSAPFFLIGALIGLVWFLGALIWQSMWVGVQDTRKALKKT